MCSCPLLCHSVGSECHKGYEWFQIDSLNVAFKTLIHVYLKWKIIPDCIVWCLNQTSLQLSRMSYRLFEISYCPFKRGPIKRTQTYFKPSRLSYMFIWNEKLSLIVKHMYKSNKFPDRKLWQTDQLADDRPTNQKINQPRDGRTDSVVRKFHYSKWKTITVNPLLLTLYEH